MKKDKKTKIKKSFLIKYSRRIYPIYSLIVAEVKFWKRQKSWILRNLFSFKSAKTIPLWNRMAIEIYSDCNRDCFFCPRYNDKSGIRKDSKGNHTRKKMPILKIFKLINEAVELGYNGSIAFHRLSEPFLDKRYIDIATYAVDHGLKVYEDTNGDVLKKDPVLCKKIDRLIHRIKIGLYDYKNEKEKNNQIKFWKNRFRKTQVIFSLAAEFPRPRINNKLYDKKMINKKLLRRPCLGTKGLRIRYDGEVMLCCQDDYCNFSIGNVFESSLKKIWWSKKHINIVNNLKKRGGRTLFKLCRKCVSGGY